MNTLPDEKQYVCLPGYSPSVLSGKNNPPTGSEGFGAGSGEGSEGGAGAGSAEQVPQQVSEEGSEQKVRRKVPGEGFGERSKGGGALNKAVLHLQWFFFAFSGLDSSHSA